MGWLVVPAVLALVPVQTARARTATPATVAEMTRSAAHVFRGHCAAIRGGTVHVAGATLPVTVYTFHVGEHLKGAGGRTVTFRQLGAAHGGGRDLGRLVGLPVYEPGAEYVLFLLPVSRAGMTSPAGAAEGAFVIEGEQVRGLLGERAAPVPAARAAPGRPAPGAQAMSYAELRRAVLAAVRP